MEMSAQKGTIAPQVPLGTGLRLLRLCLSLEFSPTCFLFRCHLFSSLVPCSCHLPPFTSESLKPSPIFLNPILQTIHFHSHDENTLMDYNIGYSQTHQNKSHPIAPKSLLLIFNLEQIC